MKLKDLMDVSNDTRLIVWSMDRDGGEEEVYDGPALSCPYGKFEVSSIDAGHYLIGVTIDEVPYGEV